MIPVSELKVAALSVGVAAVGAVTASMQEANTLLSSEGAPIVISLTVSAGALVTGLLALFKGHGAYEHFKGTIEERTRQEEERERMRGKKLESVETKLDKVVEEVVQSREIMRLVAQGMHLNVREPGAGPR